MSLYIDTCGHSDYGFLSHSIRGLATEFYITKTVIQVELKAGHCCYPLFRVRLVH